MTARLLATLAILAATLTGPAAQAADFGASVSPPQLSTMTSLENAVGRRMDTTRVFYRWDDPFPSDYARQLKDTHRLMISVQAMRGDGTRVSWGAIAGAAVGSRLHGDMVRWGRGLRDLRVPVTFTFSHEPEVERNKPSGTAADYIAAWRRMRSVIRAQGASNVDFLWIMTSLAFRVPATDRRYAPRWYPGDAYVDGIGGDAYNGAGCRSAGGTWLSLEQLIDGQRRFGLAHPGIPLYLPEWGSVEGAPGRKAAWIRDARALLKSPAYSRFRVVSYFAMPGVYDGCEWDPRSSAGALRAFREMGADPYFGGGK